MEERTRLGTLGAALLMAVLALWLASCTGESEDGGGMGEGGTAVSVSLTIRTRAGDAGTSQSEYYVPGSEYENYIDVAGGDYRIYFFTYDPDNPDDEDKNNKYIATFTPESFVATDKDGEYTTYEVMGTVPSGSELLDCENFKVVMLANWGNNYGNNLTSVTDDPDEATTIDDVCEAEWSKYTFKWTKDNPLGPGNLIPFYGVQEYTDIEFEVGKHTSLNDKPISLLRAMAKVEVIHEPNNMNYQEELFDYVRICHYNATGYCAPDGIYVKDSYDHDGKWAEDYVNTLHLVNGINDADQDDRTLTMYKTTDSDGKEMWVAYVPEYDNSGDDFSYIELKTKYQLEGEDPYRIYFANYDENGETDNTDTENRYNIQRNNLYRFRVTFDGKLEVKPQEWELTFDNEFDFRDD